MSTDLIPAVVAAGAGTVMTASILAHEYIRNEAARKNRVRLGLRFPVALDPVAAKAALVGLSGLSDRMELVFEVAADGDGIRHFLWVPAEVRASAVSVLTGVMPGLRVAEAPVQKGRVTLALRVFIPTPTVLTTENPEAASRTLLSGLSALAPGSEEIIIRWAARADRPRPLRSNEPMDRAAKETERVWRQKMQVSGGFSASALVLARAATVARARELLEHVASTFRSRRGTVGGLRTTSERGGRSLASLPRTTRRSGWVNVAELLPLLGWPLGDAIPGVEVGASRELLVPRHVPREGRRLFIGRDSVGERPVALSAETAARLHMAVVSPTGGGKSNLLMRCILDDLAAGYGGILLDPKNDLVSDLLDRIPPGEQAARVVVLDASAPGPVPGLDLLGSGDPDVRAEVVLSALKGIYKDAWGVRIDSYLRLGLRTLAELPNPVLSDWMRLYTDRELRRTAVARLHDPILAAQWRTYDESLSAAEQFQHIAPALARITSLLSRPALRNIINQPEPKLSIPRLLAERKWLLVALSPTIGESANDLLSAIVGYLVWTAIEQRVSLPAQQRRPVFFYCDELHSLHLPVGLEVFLERSRGLGCGVVAATQGLARLPDSVRNSLLGNVGSLIAMKATGHDEAARLARELPGLQASDLMGLARFECAARINTGGLGSGSAVVTGRTEGPPPVTGQARAIRALTAERYGTDPRELEAELRRRVEGQPRTDEGQLGQARRAT